MAEKDTSFTLPSNEADRTKIKNALREISAQLQMIDDRKSAIKDIVDHLHDEYSIPKKISNQLGKTLFKYNYDDVQHEADTFQMLYETLIINSQETDESEEDNS